MPHQCRLSPPRIYAARVYGQIGSFHYFEGLLGNVRRCLSDSNRSIHVAGLLRTSGFSDKPKP
jgi:hypothetical protein